MSVYGGGGRSCDPTDTVDWPDTRDVSSEFLETILNHEPYRGALTRTGVLIRCARFKETVDLSNMVLAHRLGLKESRFQRNVDLTYLRTSSLISLEGSTFDGRFDADGLEVADGLYMSGGAQFKQVRLVGAKVGNVLSTIGSSFGDPFIAEHIEVAGSMFMRGGASFENVNLNGAEISGQLQLRDSDFKGHLDLTSASIGEEFQLTAPRGGNGPSSGNKNHPPPRWAKEARLTLRNTRVGALNDTENAWNNLQARIDLVGFTYDRLGGASATRQSAMDARSDEWLLAWLAKQNGYETTYNPQPFEQLAKVLRESEYPGKADAILFEARNHQRESPETPLIIQTKLWLQWGLIGYGYHNWIALIWFAGLIGLGTFACGKSTFGRRMRYSQRFWYSVDMALPIIELNPRHEVVKIAGGVVAYFYFHKLAGFVLVSFLIAGLSGLTK